MCKYKTFAAYGCNPLVVANLYWVLNRRDKDLVRKAIVVVLRSSFKVVELRHFLVLSMHGPE